MRRRVIALSLCACADITPIEDGAQVGEAVVLQDWFTSAVVVPTDAGAILIDAGFRSGRIESALDDQGLSPDDITDVLVTHGHSDHVGALDLFSGARVHALDAEVDLVAEETPGPVVTDILAPDATLTLGRVDVEVFAMPGHTPGSAAFLVGGALMLGDAALLDREGLLVPVPEGRSEDPALAEASLRALADRLEPRAEEVAWLVPSHSGPAAGLQPLLDYRDR